MSIATIKCPSSDCSVDLIAAFQKHDETNSGTIEREVLEGLLQALGFRCEDVLRHFASNTNDAIQYCEFVRWICEETIDSNASTCSNVEDMQEAVDLARPTFRLTPSSAEHLKMLQEAFPFHDYIEHTEHRGISLRQLQFVVEYVSAVCNAWYDGVESESSLTSDNALCIDCLNFYHITRWLILPATLADRCAFVELLSVGGCPQIPSWFVSHWWGEKVAAFFKCLKLHATTRELGEDTIYWVSAYASRQHSFDDELVGDPYQTSFYKAMELAQQNGGMLLVLDELTSFGIGPATPFKRIWCAFEMSMASKLQMSLDIVACHGTSAHLLSDGLTRHDERERRRFIRGGAARAKAEREKSFPMEVFGSSLMFPMEKAAATRSEDRVWILNCLTGAHDLYGIPASTHPLYDQLNIQLRATFAVAAWRQALEKGLVEELCFSELLHADVQRCKLSMDFTACLELNDAGLSGLACGLPPLLKSLDLSFAYCSELSDSGPVSLAGHFSPCLLELSLKFESCVNIGDESLKALANRLCSLHHLHLDFSGCQHIEDVGLEALAVGLADSIKLLELWFSRCPLVSDSGLAALARRLPPSIRILDLQFERCKLVGDEGLYELARALPSDLSCLSLNFANCSSGDAGLVALIGGLPSGASVSRFRFKGTHASEELLQRCESILSIPHVGAATAAPVENRCTYDVCGTEYKQVKIKQTTFDVKVCMKYVCILGWGCFGTTVVFKDTETGNLCTVRKFADAFSDLSLAQRLLREVKLQTFLKHDHILSISDVYPPRDVDFDVVYTTRSYLETDLSTIIGAKKVIPMERIQYFLYQVLRGLRYVHSVGVAHCDIRPSSLLVDTKSYSLRINDFGNARSLTVFENGDEKARKDHMVNRWYHSPECMLSVHVFMTAMDMWSVGCVLGEMFHRKPLFPGQGDLAHVKSILHFLGSPLAPQLSWLPIESNFLTWFNFENPVAKKPWSSLISGCSADALNLLDVMLTFDPRARADPTQCLDHAFLAQFHNRSDELVAPNPFDWSFQQITPSRRTLQNAIYIESARWHPELQKGNVKASEDLAS